MNYLAYFLSNPTKIIKLGRFIQLLVAAPNISTRIDFLRSVAN